VSTIAANEKRKVRDRDADGEKRRKIKEMLLMRNISNEKREKNSKNLRDCFLKNQF
jgi:hypothetical protein